MIFCGVPFFYNGFTHTQYIRVKQLIQCITDVTKQGSGDEGINYGFTFLENTTTCHDAQGFMSS